MTSYCVQGGGESQTPKTFVSTKLIVLYESIAFSARDKLRNPGMPWLGKVDGGLTEYLERFIKVVGKIQNFIFPNRSSCQLWWAQGGIM